MGLNVSYSNLFIDDLDITLKHLINKQILCTNLHYFNNLNAIFVKLFFCEC